MTRIEGVGIEATVACMPGTVSLYFHLEGEKKRDEAAFVSSSLAHPLSQAFDSHVQRQINDEREAAKVFALKSLFPKRNI